MPKENKISIKRLKVDGIENRKNRYKIELILDINGNKETFILESQKDKTVFNVNPMKQTFLKPVSGNTLNFKGGFLTFTLYFYTRNYKSYSEYKMLDIRYDKSKTRIGTHTVEINELDLSKTNDIKFPNNPVNKVEFRERIMKGGK